MLPAQQRAWPNPAPVKVQFPHIGLGDALVPASPSGVRLPSPTSSESSDSPRKGSPFHNVSLGDRNLGSRILVTTQGFRPSTALGVDDARLLRNLRRQPLERIWLESHLTQRTASSDEAARLRSILNSAFMPTKRLASRQRKRTARVRRAETHPDTCSLCTVNSRLSYHSRYCRACKARKCGYCGISSLVDEQLDGQCNYCLAASNDTCASRMPMRRLGLLLLRRRPGLSPQELLDALCNYGRHDQQVDHWNTQLHNDPVVQQLKAEVNVLRQATEHLTALVPMGLEEAGVQLKDMNRMLQRQVEDLCTQMDVIFIESDRDMAALAMLKQEKESLERFLTGIKEQVNRMRHQEKPNLEDLRVHLLDINAHIDRLNEVLIEVSNQLSTKVTALNGVRSAMKATIKETRLSEASLSHRTSRLNSLVPADIAQTLRRASESVSNQRRAGGLVFDDDDSLASPIDPHSTGMLLMCARCHGPMLPASRLGDSCNAFRRTGELTGTGPRALMSTSARLKALQG